MRSLDLGWAHALCGTAAFQAQPLGIPCNRSGALSDGSGLCSSELAHEAAPQRQTQILLSQTARRLKLPAAGRAANKMRRLEAFKGSRRR